MSRAMTRRSVLRAMIGAVLAPIAVAAMPTAAPVAANKSAAISIPFTTLPVNTYIRGPRYLVMTSREVAVRGRPWKIS